MDIPASPSLSYSSYVEAWLKSVTDIAGKNNLANNSSNNPSDLLFTEWPVHFHPSDDNELPVDIKALDMELEAVNDGQKIVPYTIEEVISTTLNGHSNIKAWNLDGHCQRPLPELHRELEDLIDICKATYYAKVEGVSEASWNDEIHSYLFRLAFRPFQGSVRYFNVTSARICSEFLPYHKSSGVLIESKLPVVDYTINLEPDEALRERITALLVPLSQPEQSITQTLYPVTRLRPTAISIKTQSDQGNASNSKMQLGIWAIAYFTKMRSLLQAQYGFEAAQKIRIPAHPLIIANTSNFCIYYAVQDPEKRKIWVVSGPEIPVPSSMLAGYKCLKAMRCLATWADGEFRRWVEMELVPEATSE